MKKIASLTLIAIIIASILVSCGTKSTDDFYLVKQTYTDKSGTTTYEFFYNEEYRIIKQVADTGKESSTVSEYGYDENGYQNYQKIVATSGLVQEVFIKNDSNGRVIEQKLVSVYNENTSEAVITFEYIDVNGSYIQTSSSGITTTCTFDEHGNFLSIVSSGLSEQTVTYDNKYENDLLIEAKMTTAAKNKTVKQTVKYEYDRHGNKIKSEVFDENGNVTVTETFEYSSKPEIVK